MVYFKKVMAYTAPVLCTVCAVVSYGEPNWLGWLAATCFSLENLWREYVN